MSAINKHKHHLAMLAHGKPDERKRVLRDAPDSLHDALAHVARMVLSGKIKLTTHQRATAQRHDGGEETTKQASDGLRAR